MKRLLFDLAHLALWMGLGALIFFATSCGGIVAAWHGWTDWYHDNPAPPSHGIPFYVDPDFWYWAIGGVTALGATAKAAHHVQKKRKAKREQKEAK